MFFVNDPPLVLVHCPYTAGNWSRDVLVRYGKGSEVGDPLDPAWFIDDRENHKRVRFTPQALRFGVVRDPWSWYCRVYAESMRIGGKAQYALAEYGQGSTAFRDVLFGMTHPEKLPGPVRPLGVTWDPVEDGGWKGFLASDLGLCSFTYLYYYGSKSAWKEPTFSPEFSVDLFLDMAQLRLGLSKLLVLPMYEDPPFGLHGTVTFDDAMIRWVEQADRPVIEMMQYKPMCPGFTDMVPVTRLGTQRQATTE